MSDPQEIGRISKNSRETIVVAISEFNAVDFIDVRIYVDINGTECPTKKGVAIRPSLLPQLIEILHRAETEARATGLL